MTRTFYDVLGVAEDASNEEITEAYRRKVKEYHPDVSDADDAAEKFRRVVQAEEVLGDPDERDAYDRLGHDAYVRRVEGGNAAGAEQSPWTRTDRRDRSHDTGFDGSAGAAGASSARGAASTSSGGGNSSASSDGGTASATSDGGTSSERFGAASASAGFGSAASRQSGANATQGEGGNRWSSDAYAAGGTGETAGDTTYSVHDWDGETPEPSTVTLQFTQELMIVTVAMFFLYPILVWSAVGSSFHLLFKVIVAVLTLMAVAYMLTVPKMAVAVFGAWSVAAPIGVIALTDWGMMPSAFAVAVCWVPFAYAVVVAYFTRPS